MNTHTIKGEINRNAEQAFVTDKNNTDSNREVAHIANTYQCEYCVPAPTVHPLSPNR